MELQHQALILHLKLLPDGVKPSRLIELLQQKNHSHHARGVGRQIGFRQRGSKTRRRP